MVGSAASAAAAAARSRPPLSSTSDHTGVAPARRIASVVANAVSGVVSTRSPGPMSAQRNEISKASRPLATPTACRTPHHAASCDSKAATSSPRISQPLRPTRSTAASASAAMSSHWRARSLAATHREFASPTASG